MANVVAKTEHRFKTASPDEVYAAWLDPVLVKRWMTRNLASRPGEGLVTGAEIDAVIGGRYRFAGMQDGQPADSWGYYRELDPGRRLVFTWFVDGDEEKEDNSTVTLDLQPEGRGTHATIAHEMDARWAQYLPQTSGAWHSMLIAIDETLGGPGSP